MDKAHYVESNGIRGGLVLWWREESTIDVLYQDRNIIDCKTTLGNHARMIHITWVYGNLIFEQILKNWEPLRRMGRGKNSPWILMISVLTTKKPGVKKKTRYIDAFNSVIHDLRLEDLRYKGQPFTWSNNRKARERVRERLDRALTNAAWMTEYPST